MKVGSHGFLLSSAALRLSKGADNLIKVRSAPFLFQAVASTPGSMAVKPKREKEGKAVAGEAFAIAAPRAAEMTRTLTGLAGAGITGMAEGLIVRVAPRLGAAAPILTWGSLIGAPMVGIFGSLFTRGMISDVFQGVAAGGIGILAYRLPEMVAPVGRRAPSSPGQLGPGSQVKQLLAGQGATQRMQPAGVRSVVEF